MQQREVWSVSLDPSMGAEIRKTRPAIIVSADTIGVLPLKVIVPVTDWKTHYATVPWLVRIEPDTTNGLSKLSAADTFQVRSVSQQRLAKRIGIVSESTMERIKQALFSVFSI